VVSEALAVIQRIEHSSRHADEVLRRIQDFSRRDSPDRVLVSAHDVIHQSLALIDHEVRRSRARLLVDVPAKGCQVFGNCTQVQQLIVNIVVNALQAIAGSNAPERNVFITARRDDQGHVVFKFRDSGPGVPRDVASQIFEPFFSTKADGVGLGLSICRRIVDEHGGQLWTEPTATGATFCFSLPSAGS
jgi:signal transduction histidine kinase